MAEENKKININSFFDRVEEVDMVAGNALRQVNLNANAIQANKTLINSLSVTIEAMRTEIRDIANYIVIENKLERDREKDRELEAEDARQKQEMTERALAAGQQGPKGAPGEPAPEKGGAGGGFLSGLLGAIAAGGLIKLALPLVGLMAPLLLKAMAIGIGAIALGIVGAEIIKLIPKIGKKIKESFDASMKFARESIDKLGAKFNNLKNSVSNFLSEKKEQIVEQAKNIAAFGKEKIGQVKDLTIDIKNNVVDKSTALLDSAVKKAKNVGGFVKDKIEVTGNLIKDTRDNVVDAVTGAADNVVDTVTGAKDNVVKAVTEGRKGIFNMVKNISSTVREKTLSTVAGAADFATGGRFDFDKRGSSATDNVSPLGQVINAVSPPKVDNSSFAPAQRPNTSQVIIRPTATSIPFIRAVKNQYLSTNPNTNRLPPEIARMIQ